jgi:hypothetical protein
MRSARGGTPARILEVQSGAVPYDPDDSIVFLFIDHESLPEAVLRAEWR